MDKVMRKIAAVTVLALVSWQWANANNNNTYYGKGLCGKPDYYCVKVKGGQSWRKLFPDPIKRDIVQRVNRTNMYLWRGKTIAIPRDLNNITKYDVAPFPRKITEQDQRLIIVDQEKLAWGAYNRKGELVNWGPISSGKNFCGDIRRSCNTQTGIFYVFNKQDKRCRSRVFPVGRGGAKMPYCMFFYKGFALHGSNEVPGYRDSHGCVRLFTKDAKWLNQNFVELATEDNGFKGTRVVVQKLTTSKRKK